MVVTPNYVCHDDDEDEDAVEGDTIRVRAARNGNAGAVRALVERCTAPCRVAWRGVTHNRTTPRAT